MESFRFKASCGIFRIWKFFKFRIFRVWNFSSFEFVAFGILRVWNLSGLGPAIFRIFRVWNFVLSLESVILGIFRAQNFRIQDPPNKQIWNLSGFEAIEFEIVLNLECSKFEVFRAWILSNFEFVTFGIF